VPGIICACRLVFVELLVIPQNGGGGIVQDQLGILGTESCYPQASRLQSPAFLSPSVSTICLKATVSRHTVSAADSWCVTSLRELVYRE